MSDPCRQSALRSLYTSTATHSYVLEHLGADTPEVPLQILSGALQILGVTREEIREAVEVLELQHSFDLSPDTVGGVS